MSSEKLRVLPLGGLGEIGMNCMVLEWGETLVLMDCGIQFPDSTYAGVDLLTPDLTYVRKRIKKLKGVVVTHGHDDHIGAIPFLLKEAPLDVYCTPFPEGLIRNKLQEYSDLHEVRFHRISPRKKFVVGDFCFDPIPVAHSIIEALGFFIETPVGNLVHSGDFKHDPKEMVDGKPIGFEPFRERAQEGTLLLLSDSTNAERLGHTLSEWDIASSFENLLAGQSGRLLIALFASNIKRIEKLLGIAHRLGKKVAFCGRSMHSYTKLAHEQGSLQIPPDTLVLLENTDLYPDDSVIVLLTGSQAEPQSALVRIAQNSHKDIQIKSSDKIILSSRFIPGNERAITQMIDHLYRLGAEVIYESIHQIHVSGHGFQDELLMMIHAAKPKCFVPIHGEYRHLAKHAKLAVGAGVLDRHARVIEDGQVLEVDEKGLVLAERLELEKGVVVGGIYMEGARELFTQRTNLAKTGVISAVFVRDARSKKLVSEPALSGYGLLFHKGADSDEIFDKAKDYLWDLYEDSRNDPEIVDILRLGIRRFFRKWVSHKPVALPILFEVKG